jgi:NAD(P)-dependent dehydrogenase (short-subunit alcohol dehydrogenase family)
MKARGSGTIVNICSLSGRRAIRNASLYCASKFALRGMTEAVAQELEGSGVKCFSASPGGMATSMREQMFHDAAQQQDPAVVAKIIVDAVAGRVLVPQGGDLVIRGGLSTAVAREQWIGVIRGEPGGDIALPVMQ